MTIFAILYIEKMLYEKSSVYTFYGNYRKYTVYIKTVYTARRIYYILFKHKFRIFIVAYIPTLETVAVRRVPAAESFFCCWGWDPFKAGI